MLKNFSAGYAEVTMKFTTSLVQCGNLQHERLAMVGSRLPTVALIAASRRRQSRRMAGSWQGAAWAEEVQHSTNGPISQRYPEDKRRNNRGQQQKGKSECVHEFFFMPL
jgi:hypothetical protein